MEAVEIPFTVENHRPRLEPAFEEQDKFRELQKRKGNGGREEGKEEEEREKIRTLYFSICQIKSLRNFKCPLPDSVKRFILIQAPKNKNL